MGPVVSSTYVSHRWGWDRTDGLYIELFHEQVGNERAKGETHGCTMDLLKILTLEEEVGVFNTELQQSGDLGV